MKTSPIRQQRNPYRTGTTQPNLKPITAISSNWGRHPTCPDNAASAEGEKLAGAYDSIVRLSIIIPTYGRPQWLPRTLRSVFQQLPGDAEVIIVEQNVPSLISTSDWAAELESQRLRLFVVTPPSLPAARNFGVARARGGVVIFIDDDVELAPGFIEAHWDALHREPKPAAVVGREVNFRTDARGPLPLVTYRDGQFDLGAFDAVQSQPATVLIGCNMSFHRSILMACGGFDPSYVRNALREESDLACRLVSGGHRLWFEAKAELRHHIAPDGGCREDVIHSTAAYYHNQFLFHLRHAPLSRACAVIGNEFQSWVWTQKGSPMTFVRRVVALASGMLSALWRCAFPRQLTALPCGAENRSIV